MRHGSPRARGSSPRFSPRNSSPLKRMASTSSSSSPSPHYRQQAQAPSPVRVTSPSSRSPSHRRSVPAGVREDGASPSSTTSSAGSRSLRRRKAPRASPGAHSRSGRRLALAAASPPQQQARHHNPAPDGAGGGSNASPPRGGDGPASATRGVDPRYVTRSPLSPVPYRLFSPRSRGGAGGTVGGSPSRRTTTVTTAAATADPYEESPTELVQAPRCTCGVADTRRLAQGLLKAELHLHLHSGIRISTLQALALESNALRGDRDVVDVGAIMKKPRSLARCFELFDIIHDCVTSPRHITRITRELIEDVGNDNVLYLELRSTPRGSAVSGMTPESYVDAVLRGITQSEMAGSKVVTRFLLSINRTEPVQKAYDTVALAGRFMQSSQYVVGVEVSGNPQKGDLSVLFPVLEEARRLGLKVSIHAGEVYNLPETMSVLRFKPDRLGHMCSLAPDVLQRLCSSSDLDRVPIEICPSSNVVTKKLHGLGYHPTIGSYLESDYPVAVCTDGTMLFDTTLSSELADVATAFHLEATSVVALARRAFDFAFCSAADKAKLKREFDAHAAALHVPLTDSKQCAVHGAPRRVTKCTSDLWVVWVGIAALLAIWWVATLVQSQRHYPAT